MVAIRREHRGAARDARLTVLLSSSTGDLTITCDDLTGWPTGAVGPFFAVLDEGTSSEEKVLCVSRTGNVLTVYSTGFNGRAQDNTTISQHAVNAAVAHCITAQEMDESNAHIMATADVHGVSGALAGVGTVTAAVAVEAGIRSAADNTKPTVYTGTSTPTAERSGDEWMDGNYSPARKKYWNGTAWVFSGGAAATVSGSTGVAATASYTDASGFVVDTYKWNADGTVTFNHVGKALVRVLACAGGGGGDNAFAGGGGGDAKDVWVEVEAGTYAVTIGPGGAGANNAAASPGTATSFGTLLRVGGGLGARNVVPQGQRAFGPAGGLTSNQSGAGAAAVASGLTPGAGLVSSIYDGSTIVEYGPGGASGSTSSGAANTGQGGGGGSVAAAGGSGVLVLSVRRYR